MQDTMCTMNKYLKIGFYFILFYYTRLQLIKHLKHKK